MAMPDKKTYRTKGRNATSGILLKGAAPHISQLGSHTARVPGNVRELTGYRTATSIPSKFETVLHTGNKERNGFNTRVYRFGDSEVTPRDRGVQQPVAAHWSLLPERLAWTWQLQY